MSLCQKPKSANQFAKQYIINHRVILGAFLGAVLCLPSLGWCARTRLDKTALVVNQETVTENEIEEAVAAYAAAQGQKPPAPGSKEYRKLRDEITETIIQELLMSQAADSLGVTIADEELDRQVDQQVENIRKHFASKKEFQAALAQEGITEDNLRSENHRKLLRQMKAQRAMAAKREENKDDSTVSKEAVKARFDKKPSDFDRAQFALIMFRVPEGAQKGYAAEAKKQAEDLKKKIEGGADFGAMAKKYSEDPLSAEHNGDMGEMTRLELSDLDRSLSKAVFTQPVKQMTVVTTKSSVCLVRVSSRSKADFAEAAPAIRRLLQGKQQATVMETWYKELRAKAYIQKY
jgi:parvulin-like peptidyl-prolyl isomerase